MRYDPDDRLTCYPDYEPSRAEYDAGVIIEELRLASDHAERLAKHLQLVVDLGGDDIGSAFQIWEEDLSAVLSLVEWVSKLHKMTKSPYAIEEALNGAEEASQMRAARDAAIRWHRMQNVDAAE